MRAHWGSSREKILRKEDIEKHPEARRGEVNWLSGNPEHSVTGNPVKWYKVGKYSKGGV